MMNKNIYWAGCLLLLMSCQQSELSPVPAEQCVLELESVRTQAAPSASSNTVDSDLAVTVLDAEGKVSAQYAAGTVPSRIVLTPGVFTVKAYTDNADTWMQANEGKGEGYYYGEDKVTLVYDQPNKLVMTVPMINYAVELRLPEKFESLFTEYTFTVTSGDRHLSLRNGEKAYFAVSEAGFTYQLSVTNSMGVTNTTMSIVVQTTEAGKLYSVQYEYDFDKAALTHDVQVSK